MPDREPTLDGLLRAVEGDARRRERMRLADLLRAELDVAAMYDPRTVGGRLRDGLARALEVLPQPDYRDDGPWTELAGSVCGEIDGVDVGVYLEEDDPMPIRLRVVDGSDEVVAQAWLNADEAAELEDLLRHARRRLAETRPVHDGETGADAP